MEKQTKIFVLLGLTTFLATAVTAKPINAQVAKQQLNETAKQKVLKSGINLEALVRNESNDLVVEYNIDVAGLSNDEERLNHLANAKKTILSKVSRAGGIQTLRDFNGLPMAIYRVQNRETLVHLLNDPDVKTVYPNRVNKTTMAQSLPLMRQPQAKANGFTGEGSSVVILDTGVNYRHADFGCTAVNTPANTCRVVRAFDSAPNDGYLDNDGHGSNVAGIAAQVAPKAKIIGIDVFRSSPYGSDAAYDSDVIAGINWAINNAKTFNIKSMNLSITSPGTGYTSECEGSGYKAAFAGARAAGIVPVVSSGNDGFANGVTYPACVAGAVRVGAVYDSYVGRMRWGNGTCYDSSTAADQVACFSNGGRLVTLLAPGAMITAGGHTYGGTSQAAPQVAGAIAVLRANSVNSNETIDQTIYRLRMTATPVVDYRTNWIYPRLDLLSATNGLTRK